MKVFKKSGEEFLVIKDYKQVGTFMEVAYIDATVKSPYPIQFEIGDYVIFDYNGLKYSLYSIPSVKKQARSGSYNEAFIYEVKFKADTEQLAQCPLLDIVPSDNNIHFTSLPSFSTYENVYGIAARIQANIDYLFPSQWQIRVADTDNRELLDVLSDAREFSVSGASCLDACSKIYDVWGVSYIHTFEDGVNVITFGKSAGVTSPFRYGKGQGLRAFKRNIQNTDELCTRLYAYGSSRNLPARWYNDKGYISESQYAPNLMLPPSLWKDGKPQGAYIDAIIKTEAGDTILIDDRLERYGLNIKTFVYDGSDGREEIYPSIEKVTAKNIRDAKSDLAEKKYIPSLELYADTDRMDMVLEGSIVDDNGLTEGDSYKLYSDTIEIPTVNKVERDDHSITPSANGSYNIYNHTLSFTICSFNITEVAKYRIEQADRVLFFQRNDRYSKAVIEYRIQNPSGGNYVIYVDEFSDDMLVSKNFSIPKGLVFDAYTAGEYKLIADIRIEWPEDTTNLKPLSDLGFFFGYGNIYNKNIVIARGERLLSAYFDIKIKQIGFDINDYTASTGAIKSISFKSGMCAGRTFEITKCVYSESDDSWLLTCRRSDDSAVSQRFPNSIFPISQGDQFILLNINMPDLYIQTAMYRLYDKAYSDLKYYSKPQFLVEPEIDKLQIARSPQLLREGMYMPIDDFDLSFVEDILIDSVTITNKGTELRSFDVTLRNEKPLNRLSKINDRVSGLENSEAVNKKEASRTPAEEQLPAANIYDVSIRLNAVEQAVNDRFQLVTTSDGTQVLKTKYNLASDGEITAGGAGTGDDNPDVSATTLGGLLNVDDSADEVSNEDKVLVKKANETHWTLKDLAEIGGASGLDISELEKYLQNNSYITLDDVEDLDLVTADWVSGNYQPKGDYLTDDKLASKGYATEQWVKNQNYLDSVPDDYITQQELQSFAYITREDVSSMGYATEQWVKDQKYLTQHQDISHLLSKEEAGNTYATIGALNTTNQNLSTLRGEFDSLNSLLNDDTKGVINTWQEVKDFLDGYSESQDLATILSGMNADIASRAKQSDLTIVQNRVKTLEDLGLELRTLSDGTKVLLSIYNFASQGEVMSGGIADIGSGGSGGGLIQRVYGYDNITDVFDNSVKTDTFNAFTIAKIAERVSVLENGGVDLTGYATESWVLNQGYLTSVSFSEILNKPTTLAGYGITDALSKSGGILDSGSDQVPLILNSTGATTRIAFTQGDTILGYFGFDAVNNPVFIYSTGGARAILHADNYSSYALPLSGGTITTDSIDGFNVYRNNSVYSAIHFFNTNNGGRTDCGYIGVKADGSPVYINSSGTVYDVIYSGNYADTTDKRYLQLSGGTISGDYGALNIKRNGNYASLIKFSNNNGTLGMLGISSTNDVVLYKGDDTSNPLTLIHSGNIGSQSVDRAKHLMGSYTSNFDANECYTTLNSIKYHYGFSPESANIPESYTWSNGLLEIGLNSSGDTAQFFFSFNKPLSYRSRVTESWKTIAFTDSNVASADYATSAGNANTLGGVSFQNILERNYSGTARCESVGWKRIGKMNTYGNAILLLYRVWNNGEPEVYAFSISKSESSNWCDISQISGNYNIRTITKIRIDRDGYIDFYYNYTSWNNVRWTIIGGGVAYTTAEDNPTEGTTIVEFETVRGAKSYKGYTGNLEGNAASATKLATARTIWGQSFDGTGDVSGDLKIGNSNILDGNNRRIVYSSGTDLYFGTSDVGIYNTYLSGNSVALRYGEGVPIGLLLNNKGNVLIGTTTDNGGKLQVSGSINAVKDGYAYYWGTNMQYSLGSNSNNDFYIFGDYGDFRIGTAGVERIRVKANGNVLIGTTTNNGNKLQVAGNISATSVIVDSIQLSNGQALSVYSDGTAYLSGNLVVEGEITSGGGGNAASVSEDIDMIMQLELRVAELERRLAQYE